MGWDGDSRKPKSFYNHVFNGPALRNCMSPAREPEPAEVHLDWSAGCQGCGEEALTNGHLQSSAIRTCLLSLRDLHCFRKIFKKEKS